MNTSLFKYLSAVLATVIVLLVITSKCQRKSLESSRDNYHGQVINLQKVVKVRDGLFTKKVNKYNQTEDSLKLAIKDYDKLLAKQIRKNHETVLAYEKIIFSFKPKIETVKLIVNVPAECNTRFVFHYPDSLNWFVRLNGKLEKGKAIGSWMFGTLPIHLTLTETKTGEWVKRYSGPSWLNVDDVKAISVPAQDYAPCRKVYFPVGLGYTKFNSGTMLTGMAGISLNKFEFLGTVHILSQSSATDFGIGMSALYRF